MIATSNTNQRWCGGVQCLSVLTLCKNPVSIHVNFNLTVTFYFESIPILQLINDVWRCDSFIHNTQNTVSISLLQRAIATSHYNSFLLQPFHLLVLLIKSLYLKLSNNSTLPTFEKSLELEVIRYTIRSMYEKTQEYQWEDWNSLTCFEHCHILDTWILIFIILSTV